MTQTRPAAKRFLVSVLVVVNVCLLTALLSACFALPDAYAQPGGRGADYLCVTAKAAAQTYDVLYMLDPAAHRLYAFYPGVPQTKQLSHTEPRDLKKDFGK